MIPDFCQGRADDPRSVSLMLAFTECRRTHLKLLVDDVKKLVLLHVRGLLQVVPEGSHLFVHLRVDG